MSLTAAYPTTSPDDLGWLVGWLGSIFGFVGAWSRVLFMEAKKKYMMCSLLSFFWMEPKVQRPKELILYVLYL